MFRIRSGAAVIVIIGLLSGGFVLPAAAGKAAVRPASDVVVKLYMTDWCPYCRKAKDDLVRLGVKLVEYNIENDQARLKEMKDLSGGVMVPVIDIEGIVIRGYSPDEIEDAVTERRKTDTKR